MYLSRLKLIKKMQSKHNSVPTVNIPKPRRLKVANKQGHFPQISIYNTVEAFKFAKIEHWEHKIATPTATEWKERSSAKTSSHGCSHIRHMSYYMSLHCLLAVTAPATEIKWGGHFVVLTEMWSFSAYNRVHENQVWKARGHNLDCVPNAIVLGSASHGYYRPVRAFPFENYSLLFIFFPHYFRQVLFHIHYIPTRAD